jgi:hypothetical protein
MDGAAGTESHGKLVPVSAQAQHQFHLVFSNKTESDAYCLVVWAKLTARGVQVRTRFPFVRTLERVSQD